MDRDTTRSYRIAFWAMVLITLIPFARAAFGGMGFFLTDTFNDFYPLKKTVVDILKEGALPHWNHLSAGGKPLVGGFQCGAYYPLNLILLALPFHRGYAIFTVVHYLLAALLTYRLMRRMGVSPYGACLSGLTYALSGHLVSMANSVSILMVAAWLPLQVHVALDFLERGRTWDIVALTVVTAITFLAGAPVTFVYCTGTVCILIGVGILRRALHRETWRGRTTLAMAFPLLVFGLCAVQFLPSRDFGGYSTRAEGVSYEEAAAESLHPLRTGTFVAPFLFGNHGDRLPYVQPLQVAPQIIILMTVYVGLMPLLLAPLAFLPGGKRPIFWGAVLVASLIVALGSHLGFYWILYKFLPFFNQFRSPFKAIVVTTFSLAVLSGFGMDRLLAPGEGRRRTWGVILASLATLGVLGIVIIATRHRYVAMAEAAPGAAKIIATILDEMSSEILVPMILLILASLIATLSARRVLRGELAAAVILLFASGDLVFSAVRSTPLKGDEFYTTPPASARFLQEQREEGPFRIYRTPPDEWVGLDKLRMERQHQLYDARKEILSPNYGTTFAIEQFDSYESAVLFWHSKFQNFTEVVGAERRARMLGLFNVRYLLSVTGVENPALVPREAAPDWVQVYENSLSFPRAYFVPEARETRDPNDMLVAIHDGETDFTRVVLVTPPGLGKASLRDETEKIVRYTGKGRPGAMNADYPMPPIPDPTPVDSITYRPNEVAIDLTAPSPGWLVLNDTYHPDWQAEVNDQIVEVRRANYLARAVPVPEGPCRVRFRFVSGAHRTGLAISLVTAAILAGLAGLHLRRRRV